MDNLQKAQESVKGFEVASKSAASIMVKMEKASEAGKYLDKAGKFANAASYLGIAGAAIGVICLFTSKSEHEMVMEKLDEISKKIDGLKSYMGERFDELTKEIEKNFSESKIDDCYSLIETIKNNVNYFFDGVKEGSEESIRSYHKVSREELTKLQTAMITLRNIVLEKKYFETVSQLTYGDMGAIQTIGERMISYISCGSTLLGVLHRFQLESESENIKIEDLYLKSDNLSDEYKNKWGELYNLAEKNMKKDLQIGEKEEDLLIKAVYQKISSIYDNALDNVKENMITFINKENEKETGGMNHQEATDDYLNLLVGRMPGYDVTVVMYDDVTGWEKHGYHSTWNRAVCQEWFRTKIRSQDRNLVICAVESPVKVEKVEEFKVRTLIELNDKSENLSPELVMKKIVPAGMGMITNQQKVTALPKYLTEVYSDKRFIWSLNDEYNYGFSTNNTERVFNMRVNFRLDKGKGEEKSLFPNIPGAISSFPVGEAPAYRIGDFKIVAIN